MPPLLAAAASASLTLLDSGDLQARLFANIEYFKQGANKRGIKLMPSFTAIQPIVVGDNNMALALSAALLKSGFQMSAIRPPTVPKGSARLRVTLSAAHSIEQIERLLDCIQVNHS